MTSARWREAARIVIVGVITALYAQDVVPRLVLLIGIAAGLYPLARVGMRDLLRERKVGTELFVTAATIIALAGGEDVAGSVLMTIILLAEFIADFNTDRARASIKALIGAAPRTAIVRTPDGEQATVTIDQLTPGTVVLVRAGDRIPVDGLVVGGDAAVNEAIVTGESLPIDKAPGASVLAGTMVETGALDVRTEKVGQETLFARIVALVEQADSEAAPVQKLADRVAAWLLPAALVFLVAVFAVTRDVRKVVTLLIFTSPAELGLATPMVMIAAIARAARHGILVKGGLYLEQLAKADAFVFDKTGTLTVGEPRLSGVVVLDASQTENALLQYAAAVDRRSGHPLAMAVVAAAQERGLEIPDVESFRSIHGRGVIGVVATREVMVGNAALLEEQGVPQPAGDAHSGATAYVVVNGAVAGVLQFADQIRAEAREAIEHLRAGGVTRIVMLTGDTPESAAAVAETLGVTDVRARLLPEEKVAAIAGLRLEGHVVVMVGDGVNDAPALARADVGIAMGARGTQAAIEAADIALMTDDLQKLVGARALARRAYRTIQENLLLGVGVVHVLGIAAALAGWIGPIQAALLHLGPDVLVFLNSVKLLRIRIDGLALET